MIRVRSLRRREFPMLPITYIRVQNATFDNKIIFYNTVFFPPNPKQNQLCLLVRLKGLISRQFVANEPCFFAKLIRQLILFKSRYNG